MHIKYVINQHHFELKIIFMLIIKLKKHFYFQYIKICLLLVSYSDNDKKIFTLPCFHMLEIITTSYFHVVVDLNLRNGYKTYKCFVLHKTLEHEPFDSNHGPCNGGA